MKDLSTKIYEEFSNGHAFKTQIKLDKEIKRSVLFENGFQWNMDDDLEEYPKITLNIIKRVGKVRKSNIMQNEYSYLVNSTNFKDIRKIQAFLKYLSKKVRMRVMDLKALSDEQNKGTAIGYFWWDAHKPRFLRKSGGDMRYGLIDIRRFVVADPYNQSIQDQEWVIANFEEKIGALKAIYGKDKNIVPDSNKYTADTESTPTAIDYDDELVNVYVKFERNADGEVFFTTVTETCVLKEPTPMNPYYEGAFNEEYDTLKTPDEKSTSKDPRSKHIWNLYPFVRLCFNERDNCFYGLPFNLELIEAQKSINNHYSVYDKALQDNVLGGFMGRKGVLGDQEITVENGQYLELDTLPSEPVSNALARIPVANIPADSFNYSMTLLQTAQQVAGATNIQLGMSDFAGQSGKQTQMLLERARENASDIAVLFNEFKIEQAYIMFLFAKFYYDNEDFVLVEHGSEEDTVQDFTGENKFNGTEYLDDDVMIDISVGTAPSFSEYTNIELLGLMVQSGQLPFEGYIAQLPDGYISNKQELLKIAKNNSNTIIQNLREQMNQMQLVMEQMAKAYKETQKDRANIDTVIKENARLKSMLAEVTANAIDRVSESTQQNQELTDEIKNILRIASKSNK